MIRVLIADDHALVRSGLHLLVNSLPGMTVVGEAADGVDALERMNERSPDVVLLDIAMPGLNGIETLRRAVRQFPNMRMLMLTMHGGERYVHDAIRAGAAGYILKGSDRDELDRAIRAVARGENWISPKIAGVAQGAMSRDHDANPLNVLTSRQREVLQLLSEGVSTRDIAKRLTVSPKTVEAHRAAIMDRLGIRDIAGLVRFAIRTGLISEDAG